MLYLALTLLANPVLANPVLANPVLANPAVKPEVVSFPSRDGYTLVAELHMPRVRKNSKAPAALLFHGTGGSRKDFGGLPKRLEKAGFAVLALDLRAHGESTKHDKHGQVTWGRLGSNGQESAARNFLRDASAGINFLKTKEKVDADRLFVVGVANGAAVASRLAALRSQVFGAVLVAPPLTSYKFDLVQDARKLTVKGVVIVGDKSTAKNVEMIEKYARGARDEKKHPIEVFLSKKNAKPSALLKSYESKVARAASKILKAATKQ